MAEEIRREYAGTCGFYCGSCSILAAYKKGLEQQKKLATELSKYMKRTVKSTEIQCQGCQNLSGFCWGNNCRIKACAKEKGVSFCGDCKEFPCETFHKFSEVYHDVPLLQSGELKEIGSRDEWLARMKERWTCANCGGPVEADTMKCLSCNVNCRSHVEKTMKKKTL